GGPDGPRAGVADDAGRDGGPGRRVRERAGRPGGGPRSRCARRGRRGPAGRRVARALAHHVRHGVLPEPAGGPPGGVRAGLGRAGRGGARAVPRADPAELLALAEQVARRAGALVRDGRPERVDVARTKSSPTDVVTEMDTASEALLREAIRAERPDDGILGEE